ncbi:MAG: NUDIX hydrolase [Patescibacteria group bacterium]|nr:NUDIX hydrolase [Patescibacteria group bacterium]
MKNWKTIKSKIAFKCKYFKVLEEDFVLPNGKKHKYYIFKGENYIIVIAKKGDYFYFVEQYRYTIKSKLLAVVAGAIEKNEKPFMAAKRELKEEAGITAKKFKKLGWFYSNYGKSDQKAHVFLAEDLFFGEQEPDDLEKEGGIKLRKLKISEVKEIIKAGKIKDKDTLSAFCLFLMKG